MEEIKVTKGRVSKYIDLLKSIFVSSDEANSYSEESQFQEINDSVEISQDVKDELNKSLKFINGNIEKNALQSDKINVKKVRINSVKAVADAKRKVEETQKETENTEIEKN